MRNKTTEYPRPVLNEYLRDFVESRFEICDPIIEETSSHLILHLSYELVCPGLEKLIEDGYAKVLVRITCNRTFYREVMDLKPGETAEVKIEKRKVTESLYIQGIIVSTQSFSNYKLEEFNKRYFGNVPFNIRKGDVLANEPGLDIKLNTILEKNAAGIVQIGVDPTISSMKVTYGSLEETDPKLTNYIVVWLPDKEYALYSSLTNKRHLKFGIERFLHASLFLPAVVEAISLLKREEELDESEVEVHYIGTIWANSILDALKKNGVEELLSTTKTDVELANLILGDVVSDALNDLMKKMNDWSKPRHEEDIL